MDTSTIIGKKPSKRAIGYAPKKCDHCGLNFWPRRFDAHYCGKVCRDKAVNKGMLRAAAIYAKLYWWRKARGNKDICGVAFTEITREVDNWIREDAQAKARPPRLPTD